MSAIASTHFSYSTTSKSTSGVFIFIFFSSGYFHTDKQEPNILNIFFDVFGRKGSIRVERHKHTCITTAISNSASFGFSFIFFRWCLIVKIFVIQLCASSKTKASALLIDFLFQSQMKQQRKVFFAHSKSSS